MSTQAANSIRLTHSSPQQAFRLLELTPEVLELLSSDNAPTLYLKSPQPDSAAGQDAGYVNLCTSEKTFRIRQVHSSNSLYVIRPSDKNGQQGNDDDMSMGDLNVPGTLSTIAKCGSTLELHKLDETSSAAQIMRNMIKVYDRISAEGDIDMADATGQQEITKSQKTGIKRELFDDIPFSTAECNAAWSEIGAFVHFDNDGNEVTAFRPSARTKIDVWKRILEGSVLQSIDLERQFLANDLWKAVVGDDEEEELFPRSLFDAIVMRVAEKSGSKVSSLDEQELRWTNLDKTVCVRWIGETYLEAYASTERSSIGRSEFIRIWKDLLPESWRSEASLDKLPESSYKTPDPVSICYVESERNKVKKEAGGGTTTATTAKNSRNWHERFKSQRK